MATEEERLRLRRVTVATVTDADADRLLAEHRCADTAGNDVGPDVYGAAGTWWEELALARVAAAATGTVERTISSERNGDVSVTYADVDGTPDQLLAIAARLRRRSCAGKAKTVQVLAPWQRTTADATALETTTEPALLAPRLLSADDPVLNRAEKDEGLVG